MIGNGGAEDDRGIPCGGYGAKQLHDWRLEITLRGIAAEYLQRVIVHDKHGELLASGGLVHHFSPDGFDPETDGEMAATKGNDL